MPDFNSSHAKYAVGELIHHRIFGYRGVVVDVDADFQLSDEWYETVALSEPPKDKPWYHVLVDGAEHSTYVAERNLESDLSNNPISHPLVKHLFRRFENGSYVRDIRPN